MANYKSSKGINVEEQLESQGLYKYHPSTYVDKSLNLFSEIMDGKVDILEPNNGLAYLTEVGALNTAFAVQENFINTRKLYARLANNESDLYLHMSDYDYLGRFSKPAFAKMTFNILYNDFMAKAWVNPDNGDRIFTIPRYTKIEIDQNIFTTPSPIIIRRTASGVLDIRYNHDLTDIIFPVNTNYINFDVITLGNPMGDETYLSGQGERHLTFDIDVPEVNIEVKNDTVERGKLMRGVVPYSVGSDNRLFYYFKAFHSPDDLNWYEMTVTHTDEVYDINDPTCIIKVLKDQKKVQYYIPPIYVRNGLLKGRVKFLVYTTRGEINIDFSDYKLEDYKTSYNPVFIGIENDVTTEAFSLIGKFPYIKGKVIGGSGEKSFAKLKEDVINNNLRPNLPITRNQIENALAGTSLLPIRSHDVVTGREYLVKTRIPSSVSRYKVSRMTLDLMEFKTSFNELFDDKNGIVKINNEIAVLPQDTIFEVGEDGLLRVITNNQLKKLNSLAGQPLVKEVNAKNYFSLYYHYVLDSSDNHTELRAYEMDNPEVLTTNFRDYNETTKIGVNTAAINITTIPTGFKIDLLVEMKIFDEVYGLSNITPYILFEGASGTPYYLEGKLLLSDEETPIFTFYIDTKGYIDKSDRIRVHNFKDKNGTTIDVELSTTQELILLYTTDSYPRDFVPTEMDTYISGSYISGRRAAVSLETHKVRFAERLRYLYSRVHSTVGLDTYQVYEEDVPMCYEKHIYNSKNEIIHRIGDPVLDKDGNQVLKHRKGDVVLDDNGKPIVANSCDLAKYLNIMLLDYKIHRADSILIEQYKYDVRLYLRSLILNNMRLMQEQLLEKTETYLTVPNSVFDIAVAYDGRRGFVRSAQQFKFDIYVTQRIYDDTETRRVIEDTIRETLDSYLAGNQSLSKIMLLKGIQQRTSMFIRSISIDNFLGLKAEYVELLGENAEVSVRKKMVVTPDGYDVVDDIIYNFVSVDMDEIN